MKRLPLVSILALTACAVGPDYHKPVLSVPPAYTSAPGWVIATPADSAPKGNWWTAFNDPVLNQLEPQVAEQNATLQADYDNYQQALALADEARGALFPSLGLSANATRNGSYLAGAKTGADLEGNASWTPDIWGKIRRQVQEQSAAAQASAADLANATLSAQAALAADYVDLRTADATIALYTQTVTAYTRALQITQNQAAAGVAAPSDVITAETLLDGARAQLINAGIGRAEYEHAIAVLTGQAPEAFGIAPGPQMVSVPVAPVGVPSQLLERRPDIAAAERNMAGQNAAIGVAVGAFYPDITLSALGGYSQDPVGSLFKVSNALWSVGADASETLFEGGIRSASVTAARAGYDASVQTYRQTVLSALQDVENDLTSLSILQQEAGVQEQAVAEAARAAQIALNEYEAGTAAYTAVTSAQVTLLQDQQTALTIQQDRLLAAVALYQDLGGDAETGTK
jgi:NodT family efflux transporter outer membrane factor (OMF) lipoprotein